MLLKNFVFKKKHIKTTLWPRSVKKGFNACALSVVADKPVRSAQANQGQHFPLFLYSQNLMAGTRFPVGSNSPRSTDLLLLYMYIHLHFCWMARTRLARIIGWLELISQSQSQFSHVLLFSWLGSNLLWVV